MPNVFQPSVFQEPPAFQMLPDADVTGVMSATEVNADMALVLVDLPPEQLPSQEGASVVITEIQAQSAGAISIEGD